MNWSEFLSGVFPSLEESRIAVGSYLPRLIGALGILALGWLLAVLVRAALRRLSRKLAERLPVGRTRAALGEAVEAEAGQALSVGGFWLVLFTAFLVAAEALGLPALSAWIAGFGRYVPKFIIAAIIVFAGLVAGRIAGATLARLAAPLAGENAQRLGRALHVVIIGVGFLVAANQVDIDVSLITTMAMVLFGAALFGASLAFALGAKGVVSNILAMHYFAKRHGPGDVIIVGEFEGRVVATTATSVVIDAIEGQVEIPGSHFANAPCVRKTMENSDVG